jgi:hypothetical protein
MWGRSIERIHLQELRAAADSGGFLCRHESYLIAQVFDALEQSLEDYRRIALIKVVAAQISVGLLAAQLQEFAFLPSACTERCAGEGVSSSL